MFKTKQILIDAYNPQETKFFLTDKDNRLEEFYYENVNKKTIKGNIYLGKVSRIEPSLQAAFIDYGSKKKGFLSFDMVHPKNYKIPISYQEKLIQELKNKNNNQLDNHHLTEVLKKSNSYKIQEVLKKDQILLVQVDKEERDNKGAFLTTFISISGRYCVLLPNTLRIGCILSRKVDETEEKERLLNIGKNLIYQFPEASLILRTASALRTKAEITRDFEYLMRIWNKIRKVTSTSFAPALIHEEGSLIISCIKNFYTSDVDKIIIYGSKAYEKVKEFLKIFIPNYLDKIYEYKKNNPLIYEYQLDKQLSEFYSNKILLNSGGYLIINYTEALISIDVNSGKYTEAFSIENTALNINLEATKEIVKQIKFRNLSGLIVIDFIDMNEYKNKKLIEKTLKHLFWHDRAKVQIGKISEFGLFEMSRQRIGRSFLESNSTFCNQCKGNGKIISQSTIASLLLDKLKTKLFQKPSRYAFIFATSETILYVINNCKDALDIIEKNMKVKIIIHINDFYSYEDFIIKLDNKNNNFQSYLCPQYIRKQTSNYLNQKNQDKKQTTNIIKTTHNLTYKKKRTPNLGTQKKITPLGRKLTKLWMKIKQKIKF